MDDFIKFIRSENELLDNQMDERHEQWNTFWHCFSSYNSVFRICSRPIISPVMTVERHKEMQVLRKQACITEVRLKTKSREKEFLNRVERSLEEIQRETSEKEMSVRRRASLSESSRFSETSGNMQQLNNNASVVDTDSNTAGVDTDSTIPGEIIHLQPARSMKVSRGSSRRSSSQSSRKESTSTHTSDSEDARGLIIVRAAKIHRRRRESGGSTGSDMSVSPSEVSRHRSKSNSSVSSEPARVECKEGRLSREHCAVRRTGSDSSCKLRRSGSERALKRTGSDRALRRTGSGDIPTAIMSQSTPRMHHRRAGSGDMSYLHSNKESAINKLTRSYDMSIRSLMSEELNVRVHPAAAAKDNVNSDLLVEPSPSGHNILLSPKYGGASKDSTAVKLLTRPATPTIKKQSPPNKESGPPQPVKAIHTLPPSLPTSRENTFDSLPLRSPLGSDSELKEDKHTNALTDCVEVNAIKTKSSYHRRSASPHRGFSIPHKREPSPHRARASPTDGASLQKNLVELKTDKIQSLATCQASDTAAEGGAASEGSTSDEEGMSLPVDEQLSTLATGGRSISVTKKADKMSDLSSEEVMSERLVDAVAFMGSHGYGPAKEEGRAKSTDVWNLSHGGVAPDSPGFLNLPGRLVTSTESLAQQWLVDKVSQLHSSGQVNIEDWLQNAPDSVKQKLSQLLPTDRQPNRLEDSLERHSPPVDLSIDDTLRSTSPIPNSEHFASVTDMVNSPPLPVTDSIHSPAQPVTDRLHSPAVPVTDSVHSPSEPVTDRVQSPALPVTDGTHSPVAERDDREGDTRAGEKCTPVFMRSNSYTLDRPSIALLLSDKATRLHASSRESPSAVKFFPSPDKSSSLPITHNRVEARPSHPTNVSHTEQGSQASVEHQLVTTAIQSSVMSAVHADDEAPPSSPNAIERNKAISSKSYIVDSPSAALLHSLNESKKSVVESAISSVAAETVDELSVVSEATLKQSLSESAPSASKPGVQRKLSYLTLSNLSSNTESTGAAYHSLKYDSADVPKKAHLQRYLQQLKYADVPARKEAWAESSNTSHNSQSRVVRSPADSSSTESEQDYRVANREPSSSPSKVPKQSEKVTGGRRKSSPTKKQPESSEEVFCRVRRDLTLLKSKYSKKLSPRGAPSQRPSSAEPSTVNRHECKEKDYRPSTATGHRSSSGAHRPAGTHEHTIHSSTDKNLAQLKERLYAVTNKQCTALNNSHTVKSFAEKEATPISTGYAPPALDESVSEYSSYGAIHSLSHPRPSTALSPSYTIHTQALPPSSGSGACVAAVIRGHLCRRLLGTCKVQSIVKTIRDCRSLLPQYGVQASVGGQNTLSLQDLNFQQRLIDQWQAALLDIHEIFFELPLDKRIALIHQSEVMEAKARSQQQQQQQKQAKAKVFRRASNKEQQPPKRRISQTTQKVIERKKVQKASADASAASKPLPSTTLKKAVLAPTFAANSPKKCASTSSTSSSRATHTYLRQASTRRSHDLLSRHTASKV